MVGQCSAAPVLFPKSLAKVLRKGWAAQKNKELPAKKIMETNMGYSALPEIVDENIEEMATPKEKELTPTIKNKDT